MKNSSVLKLIISLILVAISVFSLSNLCFATDIIDDDIDKYNIMPSESVYDEVKVNESESENEDIINKQLAMQNSDNGKSIGLLAAALATGLACIGAGIAVAVVASSAVGAISENPSLLGKTIIFAGLAEGIAIYGLIISIMILNKI